MKKLWILLVSFLLSTPLVAQWTAWQTVYEEGSYPNSTKVQISFRLSTCGKYGLLEPTNSRYRIKNEFKRDKASLYIRFTYLNCRGEEMGEGVTIPMAKPGIDESAGKWFLGHKILDIKLLKVNDYSGKTPPKNESTVKSGMADEMVFDNTPKINYDRLKTKLETKINAMPAGTYKNWYRIKLDDIVKLKDPYDAKTKKLEALEKELDDYVERTKRLKEKNRTLKETVRTNIDAVTAPTQQTSFLNEYNSALSKEESDPEEFESTLTNLNNRVLHATAEINRNKEQYDQNKTATESKVDQYKANQQEIKNTQAAITGGLAVVGFGLFSFKSPTGERFRYRGAASARFSIQLGIHALQQPYGAIEYTKGSILRYSDGALFKIDEKELKLENMFIPGLYAAGSFHPLYAKNLSIGLTGNISFNYWPSAYDDGGVAAGFSSASNGYKSVFDYAIGAEIAAGTRNFKLLLSFAQQLRKISAITSSATVIESTATRSERTTYHEESQSWTNLVAGVGFRIGDYTKSGSYFDLLVVRTFPQEIDGLESDYKLEKFVRDFNTSPTGISLYYSNKNSWFGRVLILKNPYVFDSDKPKLYYTDDKLQFEITVGRKIDFFGKPYRKR